MAEQNESRIPLPSFQHEEWTKTKTRKTALSELYKLIIKEEKSINKELFREHFRYQSLTDMLKNLYSTKNTERNKIQEDLVKSGLINLKNEIVKMSKTNLKMNSQIK